MRDVRDNPTLRTDAVTKDDIGQLNVWSIRPWFIDATALRDINIRMLPVHEVPDGYMRDSHNRLVPVKR